MEILDKSKRDADGKIWIFVYIIAGVSFCL